MSLISLVYPKKHIVYQNLGAIGEIICPTLFGGYVERLFISGSKHPTSFRNKLKKMCNSSQQSQNNITKERWQNHFEKLFQDNTRSENVDDIIQIDDIDADIQYGVTEDEPENKYLIRRLQTKKFLNLYKH